MLGAELQEAGAAVEERPRQIDGAPAGARGGVDVDDGLETWERYAVSASLLSFGCGM